MLKQFQISDLLSDGLSESQLKERLLALTPDRLSAAVVQDFVEQMFEVCHPDFAALQKNCPEALDCSGTGGSGRRRFNTSTAAAFVVASAKIPVVKFGNRAATSSSGSFDLLNHLGIGENVSAVQTERILAETNLAFIFAPQAYPALKRLAAVRASVGVPTIFNFVGPLLNPVKPAYRLMGVASQQMHEPIAAAIAASKHTNKAVVVRSTCGLDEFCPLCGSTYHFVTGGEEPKTIQHKGSASSFLCADEHEHAPADNARIFKHIVNGIDKESKNYELVVLNAGAGLLAAQKVSTLDEGITLARQLLAEGEVQRQFEKVRNAYAKHS